MLQVANLFNVELIPDGDEIYDKLMAGIEPELVSGAAAGLKAKYADETPEQKKVRAARYASAFAEYDRQFAQYCNQRSGKMQRARAEALESLEEQEHAQDQNDMASLEAQISTN